MLFKLDEFQGLVGSVLFAFDYQLLVRTHEVRKWLVVLPDGLLSSQTSIEARGPRATRNWRQVELFSYLATFLFNFTVTLPA